MYATNLLKIIEINTRLMFMYFDLRCSIVIRVIDVLITTAKAKYFQCYINTLSLNGHCFDFVWVHQKSIE